MLRIRDYSITRKLTWMNMLASGAALLLACGAFIAYETVLYRHTMVRDLSVQAQIIGDNSVSALLFNDPGSAEDALGALRAASHVTSAWIYTPAGQPFAGYERDRNAPPPALPSIPSSKAEAYWFKDGQLELVHPVIFQQKLSAIVYIQSDLRGLYGRLETFIEIGVGVLLVSLLAAFFVSWISGRVVAKPIQDLSGTARMVSRDKNYAVRAKPTEARDEISVLIDTFNGMLAQIQERDDSLQKAQERFNLALMSAAVGTWSLDIADQVMTWDDFMPLLFGLKPGTFSGKPEDLFRLIHPDDREGVAQWMAKHRENDALLETEFRTIWPDGSIHTLGARGKPYLDKAGQAARLTGVCWDITERRRAAEALEKQAAMLREQARLLDLAPAAIMVRDLESRITFWNPEAEKIYGWTPDEALGKVTHELFQTQFPEPLSQIEAEALKGASWEGELAHNKKNGERIIVASRWTARRDAQGRPTGFLEINADITERKRAELRLRESEEKYRTLFNSIDEGFCIIEMLFDENQKPIDYRFLEINPSFEKQTGIQDARGRRMREIAPQHEEHWFEIYGKIAMTGEPVRFQNKAAQLHRWYDVYAFRTGEPEERKVAIVFHDITGHKRAEEEIQQLNQQLEQRVQERTAELEAANKELEAFTYSVSHDLRAPLRHVDGFSKLLIETHGAELSPDAKENIAIIREAVLNMGMLIDDLLNLARVGRKQPSMQVTGLGSLVEEVRAELKRANPDRSIEWKIDTLPFVECDPGLMKQVFANLLSNAVKYTRPRNPAVIELGVVPQNGARAVFVRDNGVGFSMKYANKLFGVFQRLHRSEDFEGTGVGLATVLRIIRKHGGRVWAEAELDRGATFYFTLESLGDAQPEKPTDLGGIR